MDSMGLTRYMSALMDDALKQARFFDHEFIMPEHLLLALLRQFSFCQALQEEDVDCMKMHEDLVNWLAKQERVPSSIKYLPAPSSLFKPMFGTACALAVTADRKLVHVTHFVQAMLGLQNSEAAFLLGKAIGDRQGEFLASVDSFYPLEGDASDTGIMSDEMDDEYDDDYDEEGRNMPDDWHQLVTCISRKVDEHNPLIGREQELDRTIQVLCRAEKNNPLHIGEPGVGKTALVYGLAKLINENKVPDRLKGACIYSMDIGQMVAGAQFRGDFEKRIKMVMAGAANEGNAIIYIDEIHNIIGAGRGSDGSLDASNMLKLVPNIVVILRNASSWSWLVLPMKVMSSSILMRFIISLVPDALLIAVWMLPICSSSIWRLVTSALSALLLTRSTTAICLRARVLPADFSR